MSMCFTFLLVLLTQCFMFSLVASLQNITTDQFALLELKARITSDPGNIISSNWSSTTSVCSWVGVSCSTLHNRVTALYLPNMNLSGSLPPHLGNLSFLSSFNLSRNSFRGQLPPELGKLRRLKLIGLSNNSFEGSIPLAFYDISSLQVLDLMSNYNLTGTISRNIGNLTQLKEIYIGNTDIRGEIPQEMGDLHNLEILTANNASFSGSIPASMFNISSLRWIRLERNNLPGTLPDDLCDHLPNLEVLYLYRNQLNGSIPSSIGKCRKLHNLGLSFNKFTGHIPRNIGNLTQLTELDLTYNELEGEIPQEVGNLLNLERLSIGEMGLTGFVTPTIYNISSLKFIHFPNNSLSGSFPQDLCRRLPVLNYLNVHNNKFTGPIPKDIGNCTFLDTISIGKNLLTGEIPAQVANLPLTFLHMGGNLLTGSIPPSIFNISTLKFLALNTNNLSGQLPSTFGLRLPNLTRLFLNRNNLSGRLPSSISNASLLADIELAHNSFSGPLPTFGDLRYLEWLNLQGNNMFAEIPAQTNFFSSLTNCRFLRHLDISSTSFKATLPASIGNLSMSLGYIYLGDCSFHGSIPLEIGNLSNLVLLSLSRNNFTGPIPATIPQLQQVQGLYLYNNRLEGTFPNALCDLDTLNILRLDDNLLNGSIPECISNLTSLRYIQLNSNKFSSIIPSTLWHLTHILQIDFHSNGFSGSLPSDVGKLTGMLSFDLSQNQLSGNIPSTIGDLKDLIYFYLEENSFEGEIPLSIGELVSLEYLDFSNNNLSGAIPKSLEALSSLKLFNLSFNKLGGEIPAEGSFRNVSAGSFMGNAALCGLARFDVPPCKFTPFPRPPSKVVRLLKYVLPPVVAAIILALALIILFRKKQKTKVKAMDHENGFTGPAEWRRISYNELEQATEKFSESHLLGTGSFGSVYSGTISDGTNIAVKVFNLQVEGALGSFDTECEVLRSIRHRNLIKTISSCCNEDFKALVLEFMPNGTLEKWLHSDGHCLNILQRMDIMIDVASALEYLHHGYSVRIIHCDLKPSNVLLDEDMVAHVGDFGLTKLLGEGASVTNTVKIATFGYMAPEYGSLGIVSAKGDVYSFGILLLETFTRRKPTDKLFEGEMSLKLWVKESLSRSITEVMDANLGEEDRHLVVRTICVSSVLELGLECCAESPKERKNMRDVVVILDKIKKKYLKDVAQWR